MHLNLQFASLLQHVGVFHHQHRVGAPRHHAARGKNRCRPLRNRLGGFHPRRQHLRGSIAATAGGRPTLQPYPPRAPQTRPHSTGRSPAHPPRRQSPAPARAPAPAPVPTRSSPSGPIRRCARKRCSASSRPTTSRNCCCRAARSSAAFNSSLLAILSSMSANSRER